MAYDKDQLEQTALAAIKKHKLKFTAHVIAYLPCALSTFYELELEKSEAIKKAVDSNKINSKVKALNRWEKSKNPVLELAFYKLIGDEEEVERLNGSKQKQDITLKGQLEHDHTHKLVDGLLKNYGKDDSTARD